ncbi:MAG: mechanosensitive ion channel domain-containing protein [Hyphomicrobiales bacterium]
MDTIDSLRNQQPLLIDEKIPDVIKELPAIPATTIYTYIIIGIIIFVFFRFINFLSPIYTRSSSKTRLIQRSISIIQLIIWSSYFLIMINHIWSWNILIASGFFILYLIITGWACWAYFRDFIAGAIFKINNHFKINETIKYEEIHGRIIHLKNRYLVIEDENSQITHIPYSKLASAIITKTHPAENILHHRFMLRIKNDNLSEIEFSDIKNTILELPWVSIKEMPQIRIIEKTEAFSRLEITIFSPDQKFFYKIEDHLRKVYE